MRVAPIASPPVWPWCSNYLGETYPYARLLELLGVEEFGAPPGNTRLLTRPGFSVIYGEGNPDDIAHLLARSSPCIVAVSTAELPYWERATDHAEEFTLAWLEKDYRLAVIRR